MHLWKLTLLALLTWVDVSSCNPHGAPASACKDLTPKHNNTQPHRMSGMCDIQISKTAFKRNDVLDILLKCHLPMMGYILQARDDRENPIGEILVSSDGNDHIHYVKGCHGNPKATVTIDAMFARIVSPLEVKFRWKIGTDSTKFVHFTATVEFGMTNGHINSKPIHFAEDHCPPPHPLPNTDMLRIGGHTVPYTCKEGYASSRVMLANCTEGIWKQPTSSCTILTSTTDSDNPSSPGQNRDDN